MKILEVAAIEEQVPPVKYGGLELVVSNVTEGLVEKGHDVTLIASGNSVTKACLVSLLPQSLRESVPTSEIDKWRDFYNYYYSAWVMEKIREIKPDVVHNHIGWRLLMFSHLIDVPMVTTMHQPLSLFKYAETFKKFPEANYVSISDSQREPMLNVNWVATVYNGIDVQKFEVGTGERNYFAFLGRISPEKGVADICRMIKQTSHTLKIAAKIDSADMKYYEAEVKPLIDGQQIQFLGEVDHTGKNELLKNARASLTWLNRAEPFGLAYVESMACGTPVIINPIGSPAELIENGRNGFLVHSLDEMREKLNNVDSLDRKYCREVVEQKFSTEAMVKGYEKVFERVIHS